MKYYRVRTDRSCSHPFRVRLTPVGIAVTHFRMDVGTNRCTLKLIWVLSMGFLNDIAQR
jgi:hypothetical protein